MARGLGWRPGLPDQRDWRHNFAGARVAPQVDLRTTGNLPDVWDQGALGSCVAHGVDAAYAFDAEQFNHQDNRSGSRLFIYYNGRALEGTTGYDSGLTITDGIKALNQYGSPPEADWPYDVGRFTQKPPAVAYTDGLKCVAVKYARVDQTVQAMQACLTAGLPIVVGFTVYDSFPEQDGVPDVPMPGRREQVLGGHCVLVVGYTTRNDRPVWIFRNSWGTSWGDGGYGYFPQAYLTSSSLASDFWTVQQVSSPDPAPTPPQPTPTPDPDPTPTPTPDPEPTPPSGALAFLEALYAWLVAWFKGL